MRGSSRLDITIFNHYPKLYFGLALGLEIRSSPVKTGQIRESTRLDITIFNRYPKLYFGIALSLEIRSRDRPL